jgi:hypothetical protein
MAFNFSEGFSINKSDKSFGQKEFQEGTEFLNNEFKKRQLSNAWKRSLNANTGEPDPAVYRKHLMDNGAIVNEGDLNAANKFLLEKQKEMAEGATFRAASKSMGAKPTDYKVPEVVKPTEIPAEQKQGVQKSLITPPPEKGSLGTVQQQWENKKLGSKADARNLLNESEMKASPLGLEYTRYDPVIPGEQMDLGEAEIKGTVEPPPPPKMVAPEDTTTAGWAVQGDNKYGMPDIGATKSNIESEVDKVSLNGDIPENVKEYITQGVKILFPNSDPSQYNDLYKDIIRAKIEKNIGPVPVFAPKGVDAKSIMEARAKFVEDSARYQAEVKQSIGKMQSEVMADFGALLSNDVKMQENARARLNSEISEGKRNQEVSGLVNSTKSLPAAVGVKGKFDPSTFENTKDVAEFANKIGAYNEVMHTKSITDPIQLTMFISQNMKLERLPETGEMFKVLFDGLGTMSNSLQKRLQSGEYKDIPGAVMAKLLSNAPKALKYVKEGGLEGFRGEIKSHIGDPNSLKKVKLDDTRDDWDKKGTKAPDIKTVESEVPVTPVTPETKKTASDEWKKKKVKKAGGAPPPKSKYTKAQIEAAAKHGVVLR